MERLIEMTRLKKECMFVAFIDMGKVYDKVDRGGIETLWCACKIG